MTTKTWFTSRFRRFPALFLLYTCCQLPLVASAATVAPVTSAKPREFTVLAVNDIYNIEGVDARKNGSLARLRTLRAQLASKLDGKRNPVLLLNAGDFLFPSSMSNLYQGEQMVDVMNLLDGGAGFDNHYFVTFGNHEFDKKSLSFAPTLAKRIAQSRFHWLGSNVALSKEASLQSADFKRALRKNVITTINGIKVGLFSITTNVTVPEYATINGDYRAVAEQQIADLKARGAKVIIALTHLTINQDRTLLEQLGENGPDVIFGGHEHNRQVQCVGKRCVIKADADARSATIAKISLSPSGEVNVSHRFSVINDAGVATDPQVNARTEYWVARYEKEYCETKQLPANCLQEAIGKTDVDLIGEELEIRRYETNLGSYIAEEAIKVFDNIPLPDQRKVQIALINSGSLRLNQNIPAGTELTQWYMNGIFQYPSSFRLIEISGKQLKQVVAHTIEDWTGNGWWLQSAGFAFRHDTAKGSFSELSLIDKDGKKTLVQDDQRILAVAADYIANPKAGNQDGYTMLNLENEIKYAERLFDMKEVTIDAIKAAWKNGKAINPPLPGRVCSSDRATLPCVLNN